MTRRCLFAFVLACCLADLVGAARCAAESLIDERPTFFQIRSTDRRLAQAVEHGLRNSPTFRRLVAHINVSNVVVYVTCGWGPLPPGLSGQLTFLSASGGYRYVVVRVDGSLNAPRLIAMLGHELQHAREIADTDAIVDADSLARAYTSGLGYERGRGTFDSAAAIRAGEQVLRELLAAE